MNSPESTARPPMPDFAERRKVVWGNRVSTEVQVAAMRDCEDKDHDHEEGWVVISEGTTQSNQSNVKILEQAIALRERLAQIMPKDDWTLQDYTAHGRR